MKTIDQKITGDVLVIGGGLAGCLAALEAKEALGREGRVVIVDKGFLSRSGQSPFAAGIWTFFDPDQDDMGLWLEEIVTSGEYLNDQLWCKQLFELGHVVALKLDRWARELGQSVFLKDEKGRMLRRQSRGHHHSRHVMINSLPMMDTLRQRLIQKGVEIYDRIMITDLSCNPEGMSGAAGFNYQQDTPHLFFAPAMVLAASGSGFKATYLGHRNLTGDLQVAAFEEGAALTNMEQFYSNTVARDFDIHGLNLYVGVGGRFLNGLDQEFMWDYHPELGNRAPLQYLTVAFSHEVAEGRGPIHLDITRASQKDQDLCRQILPESFRIWDRAGVSPFSAKVPWMMALRGTCAGGGGIRIDLDCQTTVKGLYAAGDICWIGPHGTYSFGGINIGFTSVSGYVAGEKAAQYRKSLGPVDETRPLEKELKERLRQRMAPLTRSGGKAPEEALLLLQEAIVPYTVSYLKSAQTLNQALSRVSVLEKEQVPNLEVHSAHDLVKAIEVENMIKLSRMMLQASLLREESRGFHFRKEFPYTDNEHWLKRILIKEGPEDTLITETEEVDTPFVKPKELRSLPPGVKRVTTH
ncbi:MAG: FAD-dependent oxidoreductase [Thermodesulfobacteriota bacterium]